MAGVANLAAALAGAVRLETYAAGAVLIEQGHSDTDVAFLLAGSVEVLVHGRRIAVRKCPANVGEMAAIDPAAPRSATVRALERTTAGWLTDEQLVEIADANPGLWRGLAQDIAQRLRERNGFHHPPNARPRVFLGSSVERLPVARAIQLALDHDDFDVQPWEDETFRPSHYAVPELVRALDRCDFGVFCLGDDDAVESRGRRAAAPRDNVIFEVGLFMGRLGHERVLLVRPRGIDLKVPSDLIGLDTVDYRPPAEGDEVTLGAASERIRRVIRRLGPR